VRRLIAALVLVGLMGASCGWKPPGMTSQTPDTCTDADGPTPDTVRLAIDTLPVATPGSSWTEAARGHARKCRLYWVQVKPTDATASSPAQLLFFDHNIPLGTPTPNPKPYPSVLYSTRGEGPVPVAGRRRFRVLSHRHRHGAIPDRPRR
jgi:hypothetical protein